jgi:UDP-N-acetylglucosamine--N-acetylmuramyl-(pentapeptide) pyrophosphoryl-undecaprenol N-acetylglucosamine transferase
LNFEFVRMNNLRVIIAGGGTGGHIFPAIAIAQALQRLEPDVQLLFVGAKGKMEMEKVPHEGFEIKGLDIVGFNRGSILKNISLPLKLFRSRLQARKIIRAFNPGIMVGVGGYASFPILFAGQGMNIPTLIQEQNSHAGRSNKILAWRAKAVCVAYKNMELFFSKNKIILTGNPVRKSISLMSKTPAEGKAWFSLDQTVKTVLIIGGSLGAKSINEVIDGQLDAILGMGVQVIWQAGKLYYEQARQRAAGYADVKVFDFISDMDCAYAAADVVISRAGALAIAELCIAARPVIFVPYPFAAEDHQTSNAMALVNHQAALLVRDRDIKTGLVKTLGALLHDNDMQKKMSANLKAMAINDADERIAKKVMEIAVGNG